MKLKLVAAAILLVAVSLAFSAFITEAKPQEGHQTMIITAFKDGKDIKMGVSQKGNPYRQEELRTDRSDGDLGPLLNFIDQQYELGWKLVSSDVDNGYYYFLMEK